MPEIPKEQTVVFCPYCGTERDYKVWSNFAHLVVRGKHIGYQELSGICEVCGHELYVPWINDTNVERREQAYAGR